MERRTHIRPWLAALALLATLSGCGDTHRQVDGPRTFQAAELNLGLVQELVSKHTATDDRSSSVVDNLLQPAYFDFTLRPLWATNLDQHYFAWFSLPGTVNHRLNIGAIWLGPRGNYGYEMAPHGQNFNLPVTLCIDVTPLVDLDLADADSLLMLLDNEDGSYEEIPAILEIVPAIGDQPVRIRLRATIWHFSKYVIGVGPPPGGDGSN